MCRPGDRTYSPPAGEGGDMTSVVVGDGMLDRDLDGRAERLSPDAPVPVVDEVREHTRPGGAGLAAEETSEVTLVAPFGSDDVSRTLRDLLGPRVRLVGLPLNGGPPEKTRVRAGGRPLVRIDRAAPEDVGEPSAEVEAEAALVETDAVLVSDHGRDAVVRPRMRELPARAARRVPVMWDPHPRGMEPVPGARLIGPNFGEALAWCGERDTSPEAVGALLSHGSGALLVFPAVQVEGRDTCGAGDRFAAAVTARLASGALPSEAIEAGVATAAAFVQRGAASTVSSPDSSRTDSGLVAATQDAGCTVVATGGRFDVLHAGHGAPLRAARALGDRLVVCLNSDASVRRSKGAERPADSAADRAAVLSALECVDAVEIFEENTPERVLCRLRPDVWVKGGDDTVEELPEASVVAGRGGRGGRTVVPPYLPGRSTAGTLARRP